MTSAVSLPSRGIAAIVRVAALKVACRVSVLVGLLMLAVSLAAAQESYPASVTNVVDGDAVADQVAGGPRLKSG